MSEQKFLSLQKSIRSRESLLIAFSGGIDSALLLKVAFDLLGNKVAACTAISPSLPERELLEARKFTQNLGVRHYMIEYDELEIPGYSDNGSDRCYLCKRELFSRMNFLAKEKGFFSMAYGANLDDLKETRPGMKAAGEFQVAAPLLEAGFAKSDIRLLARELGLSVWNKPAMACLSSRIPSGSLITHSKLKQVEAGEQVLRNAGFGQVRVRHHDGIARIEILISDLSRFEDAGLRDAVVKSFKEIGFQYVTLDLEGYRAGSVSGGPVMVQWQRTLPDK
ncbi:MAG TPA: ATP-dependent sacrificial sulfur transferase LarE [Nitrospiria bacterium]|nr:ATP-dependent sacrificial sulfur transferase LarE [Nitrospiria bacterium]